jgi:glycosyltransferase involved in cell wall biosynthesis
VSRRLLMLSTSYPLRAGMDAGVFVQRLAENLPASWQVEVVCPADRQPSVESTPSARVRLMPVRYAPAPWRTIAQRPGGILPAVRTRPWRLALVPALLLALAWTTARRARHCDLIHGNWALCGLIAGVVGLVLRKPVVTTLRGEDVSGAGGGLIGRLVIALVMRLSTQVVCVSQPMADALRARHPGRAGKVHVCLNGVEPALFAVPPVALADEQAPTLVMVGSLIRRKGVDLAIRALARQAPGSGATLLVAGDGPERAQLDALAQALGVAGRVRFLGAVRPDQVPAVLAQGHVYVMASRSEGRPNVVLEALAAGRAVISTRLPGVTGLVEDGATGWLCELDSVDALAQAMAQAIAAPGECRRRGERARAFATAHLPDWPTAARCHAAVFDAVFDDRAGR